MTTTAVKRKLAVLIPAGGYPEQLDLIANGDGFTALQEAVGGYVQVIPLGGDFVGLDLWLNEEGKLIGLPFNELATLMWEESFGRGTDLMVGNAVVTKSANANGTTPSMTEKQIQRLLDELITRGRKARWSL